jgi:uncharacterized phage-associated protein
MASIADVAAYILSQAAPMTSMKLQKLCFYSYGYHLAWEERPLFPEHFEAWANGPVAPVLYRMHRGRYQLGEGEIDGKPDALDAGERESIDLVLSGLGKFTAHQLSTMTHQEPPWMRARERARVADLDRSDEHLTDSDIAEFFTTLTARDSDLDGC